MINAEVEYKDGTKEKKEFENWFLFTRFFDFEAYKIKIVTAEALHPIKVEGRGRKNGRE